MSSKIWYPTPYHSFSLRGSYSRYLPFPDSVLSPAAIDYSRRDRISRRAMLKGSACAIGAGSLGLSMPTQTQASPFAVAAPMFKGCGGIVKHYAGKVGEALLIDALLRATKWMYEDVINYVVKIPEVRRAWNAFLGIIRKALEFVAEKLEDLQASVRKSVRPATRGNVDYVGDRLGIRSPTHLLHTDEVLIDGAEEQQQGFRKMWIPSKIHKKYGVPVGWNGLMGPCDASVLEYAFYYHDTASKSNPLFDDPKIANGKSVEIEKPKRSNVQDVYPSGRRFAAPKGGSSFAERALKAFNKHYFDKEDADGELLPNEMKYFYPLRGKDGVEHMGLGFEREHPVDGTSEVVSDSQFIVLPWEEIQRTAL